MPVDECYCCGGRLAWNWSEAFDKFGFNDGDGQVETNQVCDALEDAGYTVETVEWGLHNTIIRSIIKNGRELMPSEDCGAVVGYVTIRALTCPQASSHCWMKNCQTPTKPMQSPPFSPAGFVRISAGKCVMAQSPLRLV